MGAVYREELSANARKLIEQLLSLPQGWVTAAALAESIGVSRRTVLRELPAVEQWMQAAGAHFVRNPGKGLLLDEAPERRDALRTGQQQEAADLLEQGFDRGFFADCKPPHTK